MSAASFRGYIRKYLGRYRPSVAIGISALVIVNSAELALPLILKKFLDDLEQGKAEASLSSILLGLCLVVVLQTICRFLWRYFMVRSSTLESAQTRREFSKKIFKKPISSLGRSRVGTLMGLVTEDVEAIRMFLGPGLLAWIDAGFFLVTVPLIFFWLDWRIALTVLIPTLAIPMIFARNQRRVFSLSQDVQKRVGEVSEYMRESVATLRLARTFVAEKGFIERFSQKSAHLTESQRSLARVQTSLTPAVETVVVISMISLILWLPFVGLGTVIAFQRYLKWLVWPLSAAVMGFFLFQKGAGSDARLQSFFSSEETEGLPDRESFNRPLTPIRIGAPVIAASNLSFRYSSESRWVIQNLSFELKAGEMLGLKAPVGAGKSTLLALILGFYPVDRGMLRILGKDVNDWDLEELRRRVASVFQEPYFFRESIASNLDPTGQGLYSDAAEFAGVSELVRTRSHEDLSERGALSGGQRQRLAIARALVRAGEVYLWDDPLASVDAVTAEKVLLAIRKQNQDRGVAMLYASHLEAHLRICDRIIHVS